MYVSSMADLPDIVNFPLVERETEHGSPNEVVGETPLQGDTEYVAPTWDAVEKPLQENAGQGSPEEGGSRAGCITSTLFNISGAPIDIMERVVRFSV